MEGGRGAGDASDRNEKEGAGAGTLTGMCNLATTYWNQRRWKEAEELELKMVETRKTVLRPEHSDTLTSMCNLAIIYWNQARWMEEEQLESQVMQMRKMVLGHIQTR